MKTSSIKTLLAIIFFSLAFIFPVIGEQTNKTTIITSLVVFVIGILMPPLFLYNALHNKLNIIKPIWTDKIEIHKPLSYVQFIAVLLIAIGFGGLISGLLRWQSLNFLGLVFTFGGLGMLLAIYLILKQAVLNKDQR